MIYVDAIGALFWTALAIMGAWDNNVVLVLFGVLGSGLLWVAAILRAMER